MKSLISILALSTLAISCVSATASDTVSAKETINFPATTPQNVVVPACTAQTTFTTVKNISFDVSDMFRQLEKQGDLSVQFTENSLSGDLSSFRHVAINVFNDGQEPQLLVETDFAPVNGVVNLPIVLDHGTLFTMFSNGKVNVLVSLSTCIPAGAVSIQYTLASNLSLSYHKGI